MGVLTLAGTVLASRLWPASDPDVLDHAHPHLPDDHPHLRNHPVQGGRHAHAHVIDDLHRRWPSRI
jgi:hypothetical protein